MAASERFAAAHHALRADSAIQFDLQSPAPPVELPDWLTRVFHWLGDVLAPVGRFFTWIGSFLPDAPYARLLLLIALVAAAAGLVWFLLDRRRAKNNFAGEAPEDGVETSFVPARGWLVEADLLAQQGRFAEAIHHLLIRSIEDIGRRRPRLLRPALTSRDIAAAQEIPAGARQLFAGIAALVEHSLFGGRPVDADDWQRCRTAYADMAAKRSWSA